jgi:hypothetical protein
MGCSIQSFNLTLGETFGRFYIDVQEGSDLLDVTIDEMGVYTAWCIIDVIHPMTRRFFRILMPGSHMPERGDALRFISTVNDGGMIWLVFEDHQARREYLMERCL